MMQSFTRREVYQMINGLNADKRETKFAMEKIQAGSAAYEILSCRLEMDESICRKLEAALEAGCKRIEIKSY